MSTSLLWGLLAPATAGLLSFLYLLGWCAVSDLSFAQGFVVLRTEAKAILVLVALDAGRALGLAGLIDGGFGIAKGISGSHVASGMWILVGVASFFVGVRLPPSFGFVTQIATLSEESGSAGSDHGMSRSRLVSSLYSPHPGLLREVRRNCAHRFTSGVARERSRAEAMRLGRDQLEIAELFNAFTRSDDVFRVIAEVRAYIGQAGVLSDSVLRELDIFLDLIEFSTLTSGLQIGESHAASVRSIFYRLEKDGLSELRSQVLDTTRKLRRE